jgi:hypothetical protein
MQSPDVVVREQRPLNLQMAPACRVWNVLASAKFLERADFFHIAVLLMPSHPLRLSTMPMLQNCCAVMAAREEIQTAIASRSREIWPGKDYRFSSTGL